MASGWELASGAEMKFREACAEAVIKSKEHGVVFYVHESPSILEITQYIKTGGCSRFIQAVERFLQLPPISSCNPKHAQHHMNRTRQLKPSRAAKYKPRR
jgi:hypothetical protein